MWNQLRQPFNVQDVTVELEDLVALLAYGKTVAAEFETLKVTTPTWLTNKLSLLKREIARRNEDNLRAKLQAAKNRRAALLTADEKRAMADAEIAALEAALTAGA